MWQNFEGKGKICFILLVLVFMTIGVESGELKKNEFEKKNETFVGKQFVKKDAHGLDDLSKALTEMLFTGRKKGGGGGGMSMFFMRTLMDMFNATVPMMAMTIMGWMKDIMLMGAGAFMMMMYDMLNKKGGEKKIIIKLQPPEPAPPAAPTGYGPWEG